MGDVLIVQGGQDDRLVCVCAYVCACCVLVRVSESVSERVSERVV